VHNETDHEVFDPESGEKGRVYFVIVTTKDAAGDLKLAKVTTYQDPRSLLASFPRQEHNKMNQTTSYRLIFAT